MAGRGAAGPGQLYSGCYVETGEYYVSSAFVYPTTHVPHSHRPLNRCLVFSRHDEDPMQPHETLYVTLVFTFITDGNIGLS
jgi:hypothetical protein